MRSFEDIMNDMNEYFYEVDLVWSSASSGTLKSVGLPEIEIVAPPEFPRGKKNKWTPEHMLGGAVSSCLMTTFLSLAENSKLTIHSYKSQCFVKLEKKVEKYEATEILIRPTIKLASEKEVSKAFMIMEKAEKDCPVKNTLKISTEVHPQFEYLNRGEKVKL